MSLDPASGDLPAPVSGEVVQLHGAHLALTIRTYGGVDALGHVDVDTVMLHGVGSTPLVAMGERIKRGQPLIRFDVDAVPSKPRTLLTQAIIANMNAWPPLSRDAAACPRATPS